MYPALASVAPISRQSVPLVSSTMKLGPIWSRLGLSTWRVLPAPEGPMTSMLLLMPVWKESVSTVRLRPTMVWPW